MFNNLYEYAKDALFIKLINSVEIEYRKYYSKYANKTQRQRQNKHLQLRTRKISTYKSKTNASLNSEHYLLNNLKMMIYDYNI